MRIIIVVLWALALFSCKKAEQKSQNAVDSTGFEAFYKKFHEDTLYQKAHIQFPLQGIPAFADSASLVSRDFFWEKDLWIYHKKIDLDSSGYERIIKTLGTNIVSESLVNRVQKVTMERRFAKLGDEWYMIYYAGLNGYAEEQ